MSLPKPCPSSAPRHLTLVLRPHPLPRVGLAWTTAVPAQGGAERWDLVLGAQAAVTPSERRPERDTHRYPGGLCGPGWSLSGARGTCWGF